jgi:uncharacterized protein (TIGR02391 family)
MERIPRFDAEHLTAISKIIGDTNEGLKGREIEYVLKDCGVPDVDPQAAKWIRLFNALVGIQNQTQVGNHTVMLINRVMKPVQYTAKPGLFARRRDQLNVILAFSGLTIGEDGKVRRSVPAAHLTDALARAGRLHSALTTRTVHPEVLRFCQAELLEVNYFHAVLEATKSVAARIRQLSDLPTDGAKLVQAAFGGDAPRLAINELQTESERSEQSGFSNLLIGLFGTVRNPLAHNPKIEWDMAELDALDVLTLVSLIHRKLDQTRRVR